MSKHIKLYKSQRGTFYKGARHMTELEFDLTIFEELLEQATEQKAAEFFEAKIKLLASDTEE